MKKSRFMDTQVIAVLKQAEAGTPVLDLCREHGISNATFYNWHAKFDGTDHTQLRADHRLAWSHTVIRYENSPETISAVLQNWASRRGIRVEYIQPTNPQQNAYVVRFNRTVRNEWLRQYLFESIDEVQEFATS